MQDKKINVMSLFGGIECGRLACQRVGLDIGEYYSSEIDKFAIQITQKNFPNIIQIGDVKEIDFRKYLGKIDLLMGGSPCQDLSRAKGNNRQGLNGSRSGLFWHFAKAKDILNPKYFLLENNHGMPQEAKETISKVLGVEPVLINSSLFSAQNRKRLYWTNIPIDKNIRDKNILLQSILEFGETSRAKSKTVRVGGGGRVGETGTNGTDRIPTEFIQQSNSKDYKRCRTITHRAYVKRNAENVLATLGRLMLLPIF